MNSAEIAFRYRWYARGDVNGFFALTVDNMALLVAMAGILVGVFHMPADIVLGRMVPGTAFGVLVGARTSVRCRSGSTLRRCSR